MPRTSTRQAPLPRGQPGIQSFARTTKPGVTTRQSISEIKKPSTTCLPVSPSKKRKLHELENIESHGPDTAKGESTAPEAATPSKTLRLGELVLNTPRSGHYARSTVRTPTGASGSPPTSPSKRRATKNPSSATVLPAQRRPACVDDLVNLHSAFLKAVALHAMHNGVTAPADLRELLPTIERLWKKRKVVAKDLQRLLWVLEQESEATAFPGYRIANYGLGRVCLERVLRDGEERTSESDLQERFEQSVDLLWEKALDAVDGDETRVDFVGTLGVAIIHESLTPFTTFHKGQQRLQDLKGGVIRLKTEKLRADAKEDAPEKPVDATSTRRKGLLDRIKDKQLRQAKLPPPPSKEMLLRRAAAERVEEVAGVLALLRPAGYVGTGAKAVTTAQRTPFRMEMIAQNVRDSVRSPISQQEVEICVEILAREDVAGGWVNLVTVNHMRSVVLKSCADVQPKEIGAKVAQLKIGWDAPTTAVASA
ncbi:DNA mismatch repair protein Msh2 [Aspergillus sclerotioniger CBS 115572]|uniref:DNA mismatch repair protein Msh2 n=1 Tax=Aspergillus sclerotioniger CBS 115572 TaxID=1450535 RepID=A0A317WSN0_9EURO|nr:DNA mismatch repair protein Msh2 [Aspergillus sclerotioniger CBS 115572]PWY87888.1 DNA mismatch repair protein Msh2 [Aspergillus sclerotioniger CBS 115572]